MKKIWFDEAWEDYLYWQTQDKKTRIRGRKTALFPFFNQKHAYRSNSANGFLSYSSVFGAI